MNANSSPVKIEAWLRQAAEKLQNSNVSTARLDALVLLEDATGKDRSWLLAHPEHKLTKSTQEKLDKQIERRCDHEPLAYIRGKSEFYGHEFHVNAHTLEPRPETETMIDLLKGLVDSRQLTVNSKAQEKEQSTSDKRKSTKNDKGLTSAQLQYLDGAQGTSEQRTESYMKYDEGEAQLATQRSAKSIGGVASSAGQQADAILTIVDVGTGSGCIAITAKLLYPQADVIATDIDKKCLATAQKNVEKLGANVAFRHDNLLEPLSDIKYHTSNIIILANLPYVPTHFELNSAAQHEPKHAIFGGSDGLHYYRELFNQIDKLPAKPRFIFTEALPPQHDDLQAIAKATNYHLLQQQDFIQVFEFKK